MAEAENVSSAATSTSMSAAPAKSDDPAWAHGRVVVGARNNTICVHCNKHLKGGGITRFKQHLAGIPGQVEACKMVPPDVKWKMKQLLEDYHKEKIKRKKIRSEIGNPHLTDEEDEEEIVGSSPSVSMGSSKGKRKSRDGLVNGRDVMKSYFAPQTSPGSQPSIRSTMASKEMVENARMSVARWWYDANVPFNGAKSKYYQPMVDAIASIGPGFEGPSYHDLRGSLLKNSMREVQDYLLEIKSDWRLHGCSIMSDGWTNQKQEPIINFLAYSPKGTVFLKSIDTSGLRKDAETLLNIFDEVVQSVGPENIVQFITDNDESYVSAGKKLQQKYGTFFWSPCAAHCIDLMLENFADPRYFPIIDETIRKARKITKFIYNHAWVLSLMRKDFTNGRDLCRPAVTRFATHFLSLQCLIKFKKELQQMFTCDKWVGSSHAKTSNGKEIAGIILQDKDFWSQCQHIVRVSEPLVRVLRLVDGEEKPAMGYLYEAMDKAKEAIRVRLRNKVSAYSPYTSVIDAKWDKQLHCPLNAAGCFLNPGIYFRATFTKHKEVTIGLFSAMTKLVPDSYVQDDITKQLEQYKKSTGQFGMSVAIRQREKLNPVAWWENFGNDCPELQKFAIRVLSQCCSATGCERNWSTFEFIHSKKQNRLEHKRLNDLVFVRYNMKLQERNISKRKEALDPISLDNTDLLEDWVVEELAFLDANDLDWASVEAPFDALTLEDEEGVHLNDEDECNEDVQGDNNSVVPPEMDTYFPVYVKRECN